MKAILPAASLLVLSFAQLTFASSKKAHAKPAERKVAGLSGYTTEEALIMVMQHAKFAEAKSQNNMATMMLSNITLEAGDGAFTMYFTFRPYGGGAPCSIRAEGKSVNMAPPGAAGVAVRPELVSLEAACAVH